MEPEFWQQVGDEKNAALGASLAFAVILLLANLNWRVTVRSWVGTRPYPSPSRIRLARFFLALCLASTIWNLGSELWRVPQTQPDFGAALAITGFTIVMATAFFGLLQLVNRVRPLTDEEVTRKLPSEYAVRIVDEVFYNDRTDGEVECVPLSDLVSISGEKRSSTRAAHRVWYVLEGKQGHRARFPESAIGREVAVSRLRAVRGFVLPDLLTMPEGKFQCWPPEPARADK